MKHITLLALLIPLCFAGCTKRPATYSESLAQIDEDKSLSSADAIKRYAALWFDNAKVEVDDATEKLDVQITYHGYDESRINGISIDPPKGFKSFFEFAQVQRLQRSLDGFIPLAANKGMNKLTVIMQTPTFTSGEAEEWHDTLGIEMPKQKFDEFLKSKQLGLEKRVENSKRFWKILFNRFGDFVYDRS
jgi:hypothetical protein